MSTIIARFMLVVCGGSFACFVTCVGIVYSAWRMSRRDNGWDR
jgi:hypothetical protein